MSTTVRSPVSDAGDLRAVAAALRALAKSSGEGDGRIDAELEAVAVEVETIAELNRAAAGGEAGGGRQIRYLEVKARQLRWMAWKGETLIASELLKLAKQLENGALRAAPGRSVSGAPMPLLARREFWTRFVPVAVAAVVAVLTLVWGGDRWLLSPGDSGADAAQAALSPPAPLPPESARTDLATPTNLSSLPPPLNELPQPVMRAAPPPPATAVLGARLGAAVRDSEQRVVKLEPASEPKPRRAARAARADASPAFRPSDPARGNRREAASPLLPSDAAVPLRPAPPSIEGSAPLVAVVPATTLGDVSEPVASAGTSPPRLSECIPDDKTMSGRDEPVQGLTCRESNGKWQRANEVPRPSRSP